MSIMPETATWIYGLPEDIKAALAAVAPHGV